MARKHYGKALLARNNVEYSEWMDVLRKQGEDILPKDHLHRVAKTVLRKCDPNQYLLSHATIVASVDTYAPKGTKTGRQMNQGMSIDVKWPDFRVKPECGKFVNNNLDSWSRPLLLSTYRTFIGAPNYCFLPGTLVQMSDGTQKAIDSIQIGDEVISHTGQARRVVHKHEREYSGEIKHIYTGHRQSPISCTPNHPFYRLDRTNCVVCDIRLDTEKRPTSYKKRINRACCSKCASGFRGKKSPPEFKSVRADSLEHRAVLYAPIPQRKAIQSSGDVRMARLMGYYLAEGYITKDKERPTGVIFTVGTHESDMIQSILDCVRAVSPEANPKISLGVSDSCTNIKVHNSELARKLLYLCGVLSYGKKLNIDWINSASTEEILNLIGAYASGDGDIHTRSKRLRICSTSLDLLQQIQYLASSIKLSSFIVNHSDNRHSQVTFRDGSIHEIIQKHDAYLLHFDVSSSTSLNEYLKYSKKQTQFITSGDLKFLGESRVTFVNKIETDIYSGLVFNLEVEIDHSYVAEGVAVANCEHIQLPELSKGFIADAIARDLGDTCYIDILVATDRKHTALIRDILSGKISAMSMGCCSAFTTCTRCGNVAADDTQVCPCIQYIGKGTKYQDTDGQEHVISELIGHVSVPNSNQFIEASWVRNPAFKGAVRRNLLNPDMHQVATALDKSNVVYELRSRDIDLSSMGNRAASLKYAQGEQETPVQETPEFDQGEEPHGQEGQPQDQGGSAGQDESQDAGPEGGDAKSAPSGSSKIDEMLERITEQFLTTISDKLGESLEPKPNDVGTVSPDLIGGLNSNDNVVRSSQEFARNLKVKFADSPKLQKWANRIYQIVHIGGISAVHEAGLKARDLIILSWIEDRVKGRDYSPALYQLALQTGPSKNFPSEKSFLAACKLQAGRNLTNREQNFLIWKGRIASIVK